MESIVGLGVLLVAVCAYKGAVAVGKKNLFEKVAWCVKSDDSPCNCKEKDLPFVLYKEMKCDGVELSQWISMEYQLNVLESKKAQVIFERYKTELEEKYFENRLVSNFRIFRMSEREYFMVTLCSFLEDHECDVVFEEEKMYTQIKREDYGSWGSRLYSATYSIEDFGVVFNKLRYLVQVFCESNKRINSQKRYFGSDNISTRLDKKEIVISKI